MALVILTFMAVITYGTWVASSVAEEKSSRVMELLITAATPRQLLAGKVLGTGAAGLTQYIAVVVASILGFVIQRVLADRLYGSGGTQIEGINLGVLLPFGSSSSPASCCTPPCTRRSARSPAGRRKCSRSPGR